MDNVEKKMAEIAALPFEEQYKSVSDMARDNPAVMKHPALTQWAAANSKAISSRVSNPTG